MKAFFLIAAFLILSSDSFAKDCRTISEKMIHDQWGTSPVPYDQDKTLYGDSAYGRFKNATAKNPVSVDNKKWKEIQSKSAHPNAQTQAQDPVEIIKNGDVTVISKIRYLGAADGKTKTNVYRNNALQVVLDKDCEVLSLRFNEPQLANEMPGLKRDNPLPVAFVLTQYECSEINFKTQKSKNVRKVVQEVIRKRPAEISERLADRIAGACASGFESKPSAIARLLPANVAKNQNISRPADIQLPRPALKAD